MPLSRKKSCARCRQSKLKCNQATPSCSRCSERGTRCVYDWKTSHASPYAHASASRVSQSFSIPSEILDEVPGLQLDDSGDFSALSASMFMHSPSQPAETEQQNAIGLDWTVLNAVDEHSLNAPKIGPSLDVPNLSASFPVFPVPQGLSEIEEETLDVETIAMTGPPPSITNTWFMGGGGGEVATSSSNQKCCAPTSNTESHPPRRTFRQRHVLRHCALSSVVVGQLTSFPKMLIQGHQLPPFITPPCHVHEELAFDCAKGGKHQCLIKELAICAGLVEMFYSRTPQNADFVWKMIYAERDRLRREVSQFQAATILQVVDANLFSL